MAWRNTKKLGNQHIASVTGSSSTPTTPGVLSRPASEHAEASTSVQSTTTKKESVAEMMSESSRSSTSPELFVHKHRGRRSRSTRQGLAASAQRSPLVCSGDMSFVNLNMGYPCSASASQGVPRMPRVNELRKEGTSQRSFASLRQSLPLLNTVVDQSFALPKSDPHYCIFGTFAHTVAEQAFYLRHYLLTLAMELDNMCSDPDRPSPQLSIQEVGLKFEQIYGKPWGDWGPAGSAPRGSMLVKAQAHLAAYGRPESLTCSEGAWEGLNYEDTYQIPWMMGWEGGEAPQGSIEWRAKDWDEKMKSTISSMEVINQWDEPQDAVQEALPSSSETDVEGGILSDLFERSELEGTSSGARKRSASF